jgi:hypothetical protein
MKKHSSQNLLSVLVFLGVACWLVDATPVRAGNLILLNDTFNLTATNPNTPDVNLYEGT